MTGGWYDMLGYIKALINIPFYAEKLSIAVNDINVIRDTSSDIHILRAENTILKLENSSLRQEIIDLHNKIENIICDEEYDINVTHVNITQSKDFETRLKKFREDITFDITAYEHTIQSESFTSASTIATLRYEGMLVAIKAIKTMIDVRLAPLMDYVIDKVRKLR